MNAPRKFRVWDGHRMHDPAEDFHHYHIGPHGELRLEYVPDCPSHEEPVINLDNPWDEEDAPVAMMCTGLTDSEGTDIYEGDIMKSHKYGWQVRVVWTDRLGQFRLQHWGDEYHTEGCNDCKDTVIESSQYEVIGNEHEDPDLLESDA